MEVHVPEKRKKPATVTGNMFSTRRPVGWPT